MSERAGFRSNEQTPFSGSFRERLRLWHISGRALWPPKGEQGFDSTSDRRGARAWGRIVGAHTTLNLTEHGGVEDGFRSVSTSIVLDRAAADSRHITGLTATQHISDMSASMWGLAPRFTEFSLGDATSTLRLSEVARAVRLATRVVSDEQTLKYNREHPEVVAASMRSLSSF